MSGAGLDTELEREAAQARVRDAEAAAEAAQLERDTFLLRRYSTVADIQAGLHINRSAVSIRPLFQRRSGRPASQYEQWAKPRSHLTLRQY